MHLPGHRAIESNFSVVRPIVNWHFVKGGKMKLRFLCVGGFICSVQSTSQNAKHELPRGLEACPQKIFEKCML